MLEEKTNRRRRDTLRLKNRMVFLMKNVWDYRNKDITPESIGRSATTHGTHQCTMCRYDKLYGRPKIYDLKHNIDNLE